MTYSTAAKAHAPAHLKVDKDTKDSHPALADRPRLTNPYYLLIRELQRSVRQAVDALALTSSSRILDYGCSTMRYRHMFPAAAEYVGADLRGNELADVILNADGRIPLPSHSFDVVFSTQVLEHVEDPGLYLAECQRVLKPGGRLLLSTHGTFVFHPCPSDFWRWTEAGLHRTVERAGFRVVTTQGICGGVATALQFLQDEISNRVPRFMRPGFFAVIQTLMMLADRIYTPAQRRKNACILMLTAKTSELQRLSVIAREASASPAASGPETTT